MNRVQVQQTEKAPILQSMSEVDCHQKRHEHLSLKVPNVEFDFDVCVDNTTLGF